MMNKRGKRLGLAASILLLGTVVPSLAIVSNATGTDASNVQTENEETLARKLAAAIRADVDARPLTASVEDLEGVIVFALSRPDNCPTPMIEAALNMVVSGPNVTDALRQAVANVRVAALRCKLKKGTGAVALRSGGFGGGFGGGSSFSAPLVSVGGGSSNYAS